MEGNKSGNAITNSTSLNLSRFSYNNPAHYPEMIRISSLLMFAVIIATVILDFEILLTFFRGRRHLMTSFSVHVVNLTIINWTTAVLYDPMLLCRYLNREIFRGNRSLCGVLKFFQWNTIRYGNFIRCSRGDQGVAFLSECRIIKKLCV